MWHLREQQGSFGQAKRTTTATSTTPFGLAPANSSLQQGMKVVGRGNPPLFRNGHGHNPNNHPPAVSQLPIPTRTAGVKRQTAISTATAENHQFFSQTSNKRHCNDTTTSCRPQKGFFGAGAENPKKRSGGVLVVAANQHHNHNQQQLLLQAHCFSPSSRADVVGSKKAKTEHYSRMDDDANMVICEDEPKPKHGDEAIDVWDYFGVG